MKLSVSNIAWTAEQDAWAYDKMKQYGFTGLEIAPTRIFPEAPYEDTVRSRTWRKALEVSYGFSVPSMQSIWYGRKERIFGSGRERDILLSYTKKAIDFAESVDCKNLVFGCPRNRSLPEGAEAGAAVGFFKALGEYAQAHGTVVGMEANPPIYHTNYINDTQSALSLIAQVASPGFLLNLDVGTMLENGEEAALLSGRVHLISHVHISEPGLGCIRPRRLHGELAALLRSEGYQGFVSIEMGKQENPKSLEEAMAYVKECFG